MFRIVLQKMIHNGWMVLCLAAGSLLAVALISSTPMYTGAIMQRMLVRDLEQFQIDRNVYPGTISARYNFYNPNPDSRRVGFYTFINESIKENLIPDLGLDVQESSRHLTLDYMLCVDPELTEDENQRPNLQISALKGMQDHIIITHGRMAEAEPQDGIYEVIASEEALMSLDMILDRTYQVYNMMSEEKLTMIKVVGTYTIKDPGDLFWFRHIRSFSNNLILDFETFENDFVAQYAPNLTYIHWFYALDYKDIKVENLAAFLEIIHEYNLITHEYRIDFNFPVLPIFEEYEKRAQTLNMMLLFLQTPVLLMLVFFIYMVSQLVINNERNEMAVLKSRGAGGNQIFNIYLTEGLLLGGAAFIVGPLAGFFIVSFLGSANGFMEFVQRVALPVRLSLKAYMYAFAGFALFLITMLLPVVFFSRSSIVEHKRTKVRSKKTVFWKRYFLDFILIGIAAYGLYSYNTRQQVLDITGAEGAALPVDPLLFSISVLFILGAGLLSLRLFPYLVNMLFTLGKRFWKPSTYAAFIHVGRSGGVQQFLMIFLILSLAIGVFNSTSARTINRNTEEKIRYSIGADVVINPYWEDLDAPSPAGDPFAAPAPASTSSNSGPRYIEPPFDEYLKIDGVEYATKVLRQNRASVRLPGGKSSSVELMAVIPHEFSQIAWFRRDLLPYHWYSYLNLLNMSPRVILASSSLRDEYDLKQGDSILITWSGQSSIEGIIYAFIDYWPAINPKSKRNGTSGKYGNRFVVANLSFIQAKMALEPYEVWVKKEKGATSTALFTSLEESGIEIQKVSDANQEIIKEKNDPMLQGTNGVLTLGFLVSMVIAIAGFIIYWILSLRRRVLQFGILRAMGMEQRKVSWMLIWEHLLISGTAIVLGIVIGRIASALFVPLIQLVYASAEQVPPFKIIVQAKDFLQIYIIGLFMIVIGIVLFRIIISRLNVHQALKLGEE
ncbi:MAG: FtsX-like permease family protein [Spirochaetales bacterium]|jgi:putative ABC transport system permease protein|nr:FtsX-like permease family protein [Spirochaetales bacterium]